MNGHGCLGCFTALSIIALTFVFSQAMAQDMIVVQPPVPVPPITPGAPNISPDASVKDFSLTTHEAAVECAVAMIAEKAGERHQTLSNPTGNSFQAGLCAGKIQTYMLTAQAANPSCFPKISLEEGIQMFVKWAEANPDKGATDYPEGFQAAFEDGIPCLKK